MVIKVTITKGERVISEVEIPENDDGNRTLNATRRGIDNLLEERKNKKTGESYPIEAEVDKNLHNLSEGFEKAFLSRAES